MNKRGVLGKDRIFCLQEKLLCQILSDLPTKDSVRTSVLSKRWKSVWLMVPLLNLDIVEFPGYNAFANFLDRFFDVSKETSIHKLKLILSRNHNDPSHVTKSILNAVTCKIEHLDILCSSSYMIEEVMPLRLYTCETLKHLKLHSVSLADFEYVSLPQLKTMHLKGNSFSSGSIIERLISACPVLEELTVVRNIEIETEIEYPVKVLRVSSQSLKSAKLELNDLDVEERGDTKHYGYWEVVIDAPGLNYLCLHDDYSTSFEISNLTCPAKVDISVNFGVVIIQAENDSSKTSVVRKFLTMLSSAREMILSGTTLKIIFRYLEHEPLPQFPYMVRFHAVLYNSDLEKLPRFLESCPNLKSLVLELGEFENNEQLILSSSVPKCLRSTLEDVEMRTPISGAEAEMKLVKYFLENSAVLKEFTVGLCSRRMNQESIILMELLRFKRCSSSCEVSVDFLSLRVLSNYVTKFFLHLKTSFRKV